MSTGKSVRDMSDAEFAKARAEAIRQSRMPAAPPPADKRPVSEMSYEEWQAAQPPKPKLATDMSADEYRIARAAITRR